MKTKLHACISLITTCLLNKKSALVIFILSLGNFIHAQTTPAWINFNSASNYENYDVQEVSVAVDTLGNVYTAGSMQDTVANQADILLVKYNSSGVQQWLKTFDNTSYDKHAVALLVDKAGNSYVCGYGYTSGSTTSKDYIILKYDNAGNQQWVKTWDGGHSAWDYITCATFDATGNIIVAGYCNDNGGPTGDDIGIVKYSTTGTQIWSYIYNNAAINGEDRALSVASDAAGNIFITGSSYGTNARNMITMKVNSSGVNQWTNIMPHVTSGSDEHGRSITADAAGNSYVTGAVGDWITLKYDPNGNVLWTNHYTTNGLYDRTKKIMLDHNNVIVTGDAFAGSNPGSDLVAYKLNSATGASLWSVDFDNGGSDYFTDAVLDTSGNVYLGGSVVASSAADLSALIVSSGGSVLWHTTYTNPYYLGGNDEAYHLTIDRNRNFILAGISERRGGPSTDRVDIVTLKYSALVTGIKENTLTQVNLNIYPNPAKDNLTVNFTEQSMLGSTITITNMLGKVMVMETLRALTQQINVGQLSEGIYLVRVTNSTSVANGKLIIK